MIFLAQLIMFPLKLLTIHQVIYGHCMSEMMDQAIGRMLEQEHLHKLVLQQLIQITRALPWLPLDFFVTIPIQQVHQRLISTILK